MKRPGLTLPEVLISLVIGSLVMMALVRFSITVRQQLTGDRHSMGVRSELRMAHHEIGRMVRALEPAFFERFPVRNNLIHATGHGHGAAQFTAACPLEKQTDCLITWDLQPSAEHAMVYQIEPDEDVGQLLMTPVDPTQGPGPGEDLAAQSVLLLTHEARLQPVLVAHREPLGVVLAPPEVQPWDLPGDFAEVGFTHAVHLGRLSVTHVHLRPQKGGEFRLARQPWTLKDTRWQAKRRQISHGHLRDLIWLPCGPDRPDRLVLVAGTRHARLLRDPLTIAGKTYVREVACASIEL